MIINYPNLICVDIDQVYFGYSVGFTWNGKFMRNSKWSISKRNIIFIPREFYNITSVEELEINKIPIKNCKLFRNFRNLQVLRLDDNGLSDVKDVSHITTLSEISINNNNLESAFSIEKLVYLKRMSLSDNKIKDTDELFGNPVSCGYINISRNCIEKIIFNSNISITTLCCGDNKINDIISNQGSIVNISALHINNNNMKTLEFINIPTLTTVRLNSNMLTNIDIKIPQLNVSYLDVSDNYIVDISNIKVVLPNLKVLEINDTELLYHEKKYGTRISRKCKDSNKDMLIILAFSVFCGLFINSCNLFRK